MSSSIAADKPYLPNRHCERSEAIQTAGAWNSGLLRSARNEILLKGGYKNIRRISLAFAVAFASLVAASPTRAADTQSAEPSLEGLYYDWSLYGIEEGGNRACYLSSGIERSSEPVPRRRPAYVLITNRPAEGKKGIVSVDPGYVYDEGGSVLMTVGRRQFHLFAQGGAAWAEDGDDLQIIAAIRGGSTLVVTGRMKNGPATTDTFSLKGFGPALAALDRACPIASAPATAQAKKRKTTR